MALGPGIEVEIVGKTAWLARLGRANARAIPLLNNKMQGFVEQALVNIRVRIETEAQSHKLNPGLKTGRYQSLGDSMTASVLVAGNSVVAGFSSPLPYFGIVERGGTIKEHMVVPDSAKVLVFETLLSPKARIADLMFAPRVEIPAWTYAGKHYVQRTLESMKEQLLQLIGQALNEATAP